MAGWCSIWISVLAVTGLTRGYIIDDSDSIVQYSGTATNYDGQSWSHNVSQPVPPLDVAELYNGTCTFAVCFESDNCHIRIPFTGSGISVYSLLWIQINTSFIVDGGPPELYIHDNSCFLTTPAGCYNIETFNLQYLPYGDHTLDIALLAYLGSSSNFVFDYAVVNSATATITSPAVTVTVTPTQSNHSSGDHVGAVVGGVISGLAIIAASILLFLFLRQRNGSQLASHSHLESASRKDDPLPPQPIIPIGVLGLARPPGGVDDHSHVQPMVSMQPAPFPTEVFHHITYSNPIPNAPAITTTLSPANAQDFAQPNVPEFPVPAPVPFIPNATQAPTANAIRDFIRHNAPVPVVASGQAPNEAPLPSVVQPSGPVATWPPHYDFKS